LIPILSRSSSPSCPKLQRRAAHSLPLLVGKAVLPATDEVTSGSWSTHPLAPFQHSTTTAKKEGETKLALFLALLARHNHSTSGHPSCLLNFSQFLESFPPIGKSVPGRRLLSQALLNLISHHLLDKPFGHMHKQRKVHHTYYFVLATCQFSLQPAKTRFVQQLSFMLRRRSLFVRNPVLGGSIAFPFTTCKEPSQLAIQTGLDMHNSYIASASTNDGFIAWHCQVSPS